MDKERLTENDKESKRNDSETEKNAAIPEGFDTVESVISENVDDMPEVQEHVVGHFHDTAERVKAQTDSNGDTFDPDIHASTADGEPILRTGKNAGVFAKKRGGAGKKKETQQKSFVGGGVSAPVDKNAMSPEHVVTGKCAASALIAISMAAGGEEFSPVKCEKTGIDERQNLEMAFGEYFKAKGVDDIPPGLALTIAIGAYALPRFGMPKTQTRLSRLKNWVASKFFARRAKKDKKAEKKTDKDDKDDA